MLTNSFTKPNPKDYISITTGYDRVNILNKIIDSILPDKYTKEYYLVALSTGMSGLQLDNFPPNDGRALHFHYNIDRNPLDSIKPSNNFIWESYENIMRYENCHLKFI